MHHLYKGLREITGENKKTQTPLFLSRQEAAIGLSVNISHLKVLRHRDQRPKFRKIASSIYYGVSNLLDYINSCYCTSTPDQCLKGYSL